MSVEPLDLTMKPHPVFEIVSIETDTSPCQPFTGHDDRNENIKTLRNGKQFGIGEGPSSSSEKKKRTILTMSEKVEIIKYKEYRD